MESLQSPAAWDNAFGPVRVRLAIFDLSTTAHMLCTAELHRNVPSTESVNACRPRAHRNVLPTRAHENSDSNSSARDSLLRNLRESQFMRWALYPLRRESVIKKWRHPKKLGARRPIVDDIRWQILILNKRYHRSQYRGILNRFPVQNHTNGVRSAEMTIKGYSDRPTSLSMGIRHSKQPFCIGFSGG